MFIDFSCNCLASFGFGLKIIFQVLTLDSNNLDAL